MLTTLEQLETLYGLPHERAVRKEIAFLNEDYQAMVRASQYPNPSLGTPRTRRKARDVTWLGL